MAKSISATVTKTIKKVPMRLRMASRVRRRRALRLSITEMSVRSIIASTKLCIRASTIQPSRAGITKPEILPHATSSAGVSRAA